jgi:hypothetical protein
VSSNEYSELVEQRKELVVLLSKGGPDRMVRPVRDKLDKIREKISNAHRERFQRDTKV